MNEYLWYYIDAHQEIIHPFFPLLLLYLLPPDFCCFPSIPPFLLLSSLLPFIPICSIPICSLLIYSQPIALICCLLLCFLLPSIPLCFPPISVLLFFLTVILASIILLALLFLLLPHLFSALVMELKTTFSIML